tara:strand:- start:432 stop:779 length:348 start_codon:yes stop_codon:yes gene_type:complete
MPIDHVAIVVSNIDESLKWYTNNLGFSVEYFDNEWAMLRSGNTKLALTLPGLHPPHIAIEVNSMNMFPKGEIKYHRDGSAYLYVKDPDGNIVEYIYYPKDQVDEHTTPWNYIHHP